MRRCRCKSKEGSPFRSLRKKGLVIKMKKSTLIILIVTAALLIAAAITCAAFLLLGDSEQQPEQTEKPTDTIHENIEYRYNEDGQISKIIYYDNDVLQGSTDYVYMEDYTCIVYFDKDNKQTGYEQTNYNALKNPTKYVKKEGDTLLESIEYDYFDDLATLQKKTTKTYTNGEEHAEKEYYNELKQMTRKCTYKDGNLISDLTYTYNEAGEAVDSAPTTSSDSLDN